MNSVDISFAYLSLLIDMIVILGYILYNYGLAEMIPIGNLLIITSIIVKLITKIIV